MPLYPNRFSIHQVQASKRFLERESKVEPGRLRCGKAFGYWPGLPKREVQILRVCRLVHQEARASLYRSRFRFDNAETLHRFINNIGDNKKYIKEIVIPPFNPFSDSGERACGRGGPRRPENEHIVQALKMLEQSQDMIKGNRWVTKLVYGYCLLISMPNERMSAGPPEVPYALRRLIPPSIESKDSFHPEATELFAMQFWDMACSWSLAWADKNGGDVEEAWKHVEVSLAPTFPEGGCLITPPGDSTDLSVEIPKFKRLSLSPGHGAWRFPVVNLSKVILAHSLEGVDAQAESIFRRMYLLHLRTKMPFLGGSNATKSNGPVRRITPNRICFPRLMAIDDVWSESPSEAGYCGPTQTRSPKQRTRVEDLQEKIRALKMEIREYKVVASELKVVKAFARHPPLQPQRLDDTDLISWVDEAPAYALHKLWFSDWLIGL